MKIQNTLSKTARVFAIAAVTVLLSNTVDAQSQNVKSLPPDVFIRYAGSNKGEPLFQVQFDNKNKEVLDLSISDENGVELYRERVTQESFSKKFLVDIPDYDNLKLFLNLSNKKGKEKTFVINSNSHVTRDIEVTKL